MRKCVITVFTNGCFDIIHAGHIDYLEESKRICQGGKLIVGLNSDASMKRIKRKVATTSVKSGKQGTNYFH